jgi:hypothetical protein
MELIGFWLGASVLIGFAAAARNRSGFGWMLLALIVSPLLALIVLLLMRRGDDGQRAATADTHRHCPECRELVRLDARRCKHCGSVIAPII